MVGNSTWSVGGVVGEDKWRTIIVTRTNYFYMSKFYWTLIVLMIGVATLEQNYGGTYSEGLMTTLGGAGGGLGGVCPLHSLLIQVLCFRFLISMQLIIAQFAIQRGLYFIPFIPFITFIPCFLLNFNQREKKALWIKI